MLYQSLLQYLDAKHRLAAEALELFVACLLVITLLAALESCLLFRQVLILNIQPFLNDIGALQQTLFQCLKAVLCCTLCLFAGSRARGDARACPSAGAPRSGP